MSVVSNLLFLFSSVLFCSPSFSSLLFPSLLLCSLLHSFPFDFILFASPSFSSLLLSSLLLRSLLFHSLPFSSHLFSFILFPLWLSCVVGLVSVPGAEVCETVSGEWGRVAPPTACVRLQAGCHGSRAACSDSTVLPPSAQQAAKRGVKVPRSTSM